MMPLKIHVFNTVQSPIRWTFTCNYQWQNDWQMTGDQNCSDMRSRSCRFDFWSGCSCITTLANCSHPCAPVTKQHNFVPVNGRWCCMAAQVTVGLALHWSCATDFSGLTSHELKAYEGRWASRLRSNGAQHPLPFVMLFRGMMHWTSVSTINRVLKVICNGFSQNWWKVVTSCLLQYKPICVINFDKLCHKMLKSRS